MAKSDVKPWLSKWKVLEAAGEGGQGLAELCVPLPSGDAASRYILKRLKSQRDPERRSRMHREVSALRTLSHIGLPSYVDGNTDQFEMAETPLYFVMEHVPGSTLESAVSRQRFSLGTALDLTISLVDIVDHCHSNGVVHRDIKPDNIILRNDNASKPVLIDFGLTFNREETAAHETEATQHLGNRFLYLPELRGSAQEKRDARSDLTACCGILYYALTGEPPTSLEDSSGARPHQRASARRTLATLTQSAASALNGIFDRAFQTPIDRRWQSADALRQALRGVNLDDRSAPSGDPMDRLARIRADALARPERVHELRVHDVLRAINAELMNAQRAVVSSLGDDFTWSQGGYNLDVAQGIVGNTLGIFRVSDSAKGVRPRFDGRVTGTEVVLTATNEERRRELLRIPLEAPLAAQELQRSVIAYFTAELERALA